MTGLRSVRPAALAALVAAACGGSNPVGPGTVPTTAPLVAVEAISGETGAPVVVTPTSASVGQTIVITPTNGNFFNLRTIFDGTPQRLWTADNTLPSSYTKNLVYAGWDGSTMHRLHDGASVNVVLHGDLATGRFAAACDEFARRASAADPDHSYSCGGAGTVTADVQSGDTQGAGMVEFSRLDSSGYINGISVDVAAAVYRNRESEVFTRSLLHEVAGHGAGLWHHFDSDEPGLMSATAESYNYSTFTAKEKRELSLLTIRRPGTIVFGNTEDNTRAASTGENLVVKGQRDRGLAGVAGRLLGALKKGSGKGEEEGWTRVCALPMSEGSDSE